VQWGVENCLLISRKWFKLDEKFDRTKLMVRNDTGSPLRTVYLVNDIVKVSYKAGRDLG